MKARNNVLRGTLQGDDVKELVRRAVASRPEFAAVPRDVAANLNQQVPNTPGWLDEVLGKFKRSLHVSWPGEDDPSWPLLAGSRRDAHAAEGSVQLHLRTDWTVKCVVEYVLSLGAWLGVFDHFFCADEAWKERRSSFDGLHVDLGWGCMFVGDKGHERLVSRRWLEFGPWWLRRFPGDVSLVQFHDLDADSTTALQQATPGHERMSAHEVGGWLRSSYRPASSYRKDVPEFRALYVPDDQTLRVVCAPGRVVSQAEMLDACAERLLAKYNTEKPVRALRYIFLDPADVERHLHEFWLRDIEVWTIKDGAEVRVDTEYHPTPSRPDWVERAEQRGDQ